MKHFHYNIICEDIAHRVFIDEFLKSFIHQNPQVSFSLHDECFYRWRFANKSDVLKLYQEVAARSFKEYPINLLFIVADYDDWNIADFNTYHSNIHDNLQEDIKSNCVVLLPVRAIEFWLWHLKWNQENPGSTRNVSIDNESRSEMKLKIYGTKKPHKEKTQLKIRELMGFYNEAWLTSRSASFGHFVQRFKAIVLR